MKKWIELEEIGCLYQEEILVFFDIPLLFVCKDEKNQRYLVLCEDEEEGIYIAVRCEKNDILQMLLGKVSMEQTFRKVEDGRVIKIEYNFDTSGFEYSYKAINDINEDELPDKDVLYKVTNEKIRRYIEKLKNESSEEFVSFNCSNKYYLGPVLYKTLIYNGKNADNFNINTKNYRCELDKSVIDMHVLISNAGNVITPANKLMISWEKEVSKMYFDIEKKSKKEICCYE